MSKIPKIMVGKSVIDMLSFLKKYYTYRQIMHVTDTAMSALCRYKNGHVIPNYDRALELYQKLKPLVTKQVKQLIDPKHLPELWQPSILDVLSNMLMCELAGNRVTKIMCFEELAPLAIATSIKINTPYIIITRVEPATHYKYLTIDVPIDDMHMLFHIPIYLLKKNDDILFIDTNFSLIKDEVLAKFEEKTKIKIAKKIMLKDLLNN